MKNSVPIVSYKILQGGAVVGDVREISKGLFPAVYSSLKERCLPVFVLSTRQIHPLIFPSNNLHTHFGDIPRCCIVQRGIPVLVPLLQSLDLLKNYNLIWWLKEEGRKRGRGGSNFKSLPLTN